jgi:hypothetical protein
LCSLHAGCKNIIDSIKKMKFYFERGKGKGKGERGKRERGKGERGKRTKRQ